MKDYDTHELKTPEEIDAAFAKTFGMESCDWAQAYDQNAVSDYLEGFYGKRRIQFWELKLRNWNRGSGFDFMATVSSVHRYAGTKHGNVGTGFSDYACHALMKAAIEWDQERRRIAREKAQAAFQERMERVS